MSNKQGTEKTVLTHQGDTPEWEKDFNGRFGFLSKIVESGLMARQGNPDAINFGTEIKSFIHKLQQEAREEGFKDAEDTFYAVMHQVRSEAGKNQLLILSKVSNMFRSLINQRGLSRPKRISKS